MAYARRTPEQIETLRTLIEQGYIKAQIARAMNLAQSSVENMCYVYHIKPKNTFRNIDYSCEMFQKLINMYKNGEPIEKIGIQLYMPPKQLMIWIGQYERTNIGPVERVAEPAPFRMRDLSMEEFDEILKRVSNNLKKDFNYYKNLNKKKA